MPLAMIGSSENPNSFTARRLSRPSIYEAAALFIRLLASRKAAVARRDDPSADQQTGDDRREGRRAEARLPCERVGIGR